MPFLSFCPIHESQYKIQSGHFSNCNLFSFVDNISQGSVATRLERVTVPWLPWLIFFQFWLNVIRSTKTV